MASAHTSPPNLVATDHDQDPFVSPTPSHDSRRQRYAAFDNNVFSIYSEGSPAQAKRAIQAHLAETERRLQEASHLGQQLVAQRTALQSRMDEVARQQDADEIEPQLRAKLVELEREFNEVGRDTARAFIPKGRLPSSQSPAEADSTAAVLSSDAQPSPSKLNVPSRKQRNQQPHRIHDIKLATEISSSLLNQVRELQAALAEKDEALKTVMAERSRLEYDIEGLTQRLRAMDESEQRYKDENWNLETKNQELLATLKEAGNKEVRLTQNLTSAKEDKATVERELEELKQSHTKLQDDHHTTRKHQEAEMMGLRRSVQTGDAEKDRLTRKVDELTYQNQELARGLTYTQRLAEQAAARSPAKAFDDDDSGNSTPDDSPEPSPNKATPRHGQLESETLKSSLQHAHRMIQNLKNNIHREKTEKMEMRRLLQEARDDLETARKESVNGVGSAVKKRRQNEKQELFKKPPRPDRLGMPRAGRDEIIMDEGDWEDNDEHDVPETPSRRPVTAVISPGVGRIPSGPVRPPIWSAENSDAFETANERDATESDDFQTGAETIEGESGDESTETEGHLLSPPNANRTRRASRLSLLKNGDRDSYLSTASNSGDEFDSEIEAKTPIQRYRLKITRDGTRKNDRNSLLSRDSMETSESTADLTSDREEPEGGKSLLAELGDFSGADSDEASTAPNTPSRRSLRSIRSRSTVLSPSPLSSPEQLRRSATKSLAGSTSSGQTFVPAENTAMVNSGMMTEPWEPESKGVLASATEAAGAAVAGAVGFGLAKAGREDSATGNSLVVAPGLETVPVEHLVSEPKVVPQNLGISPVTGQKVDPVEPELLRPTLDISPVKGQFVEPVEPQTVLPSLGISAVNGQHVEPVEPVAVKPAPATLNLSPIRAQGVEPVAATLEALTLSSVSAQHVEPVEEQKVPVALGLSSVSTQHDVEPTTDELKTVAPVALALSNVSTQHALEPVETREKSADPVALGMSSVSTHAAEPLEAIAPPNMQLSPISSLQSQPVDVPAPAPKEVPVAPAPNLDFSTIASVQSEPVEAQQPKQKTPVVPAPKLVLSSISSLHSEPVDVPAPIPKTVPAPSLQFSSIYALQSEPVEQAVPAAKPVPSLPTPTLQISSISTLDSEPVEAPTRRSRPSHLSAIVAQGIEPEVPAVPARSPKRLSFHADPLVDDFDLSVEPPVMSKEPLSLASVRSQQIEPVSPEKKPAFDEAYQQIMAKERRSSEDRSPVTPGEHSALPGTDAARPGSAFFGAIAQEQPSQKRFKSRSARPDSETIPTGRTPFAPIAENVAHVDRNRMADEGTQTMVSSEEIDGLLASKQFPVATSRPSSPAKFATQVPHRASRSPLETSPTKTLKRPSSSHSTRSRSSQNQPPLPSDHREVIAAASHRGQLAPASGSMGPPITAASTLRNQNSFTASQSSRPKTPVEGGRLAREGSPVRKDGTTPRPRHAATRSEVSSPISRQTSITSFTSEVEQRFNIPMNPIARPQGASEADPRMIKALTDVMMGEFLWKYTRKAGREKFSENRHLRYFWVHPFTRTLYWSDSKPRDPLINKAETKAKSVPIDEVIVEDDDNLFPPGLHQKSITVVAPGRCIKFTAATSKTHETWYNALKYLLLRTGDADDDGNQSQAGAVNTEDVLDFNPAYDKRSNSRQTARSRASLSSYNSRTTRTSSPHRSSHVPSLARHAGGTQGRSTPVNQGSMSNRLATLTGLFRPPSGMRGSMSSKRSKHSNLDNAAGSSIYDASVVQESNEDLGESGDADEGERLENVRACCDGKHDVGSLSHKGRHHHHHHQSHNHSHNGASTTKRFSHQRTPSQNPSTHLQVPALGETSSGNTSAANSSA